MTGVVESDAGFDDFDVSGSGSLMGFLSPLRAGIKALIRSDGDASNAVTSLLIAILQFFI